MKKILILLVLTILLTCLLTSCGLTVPRPEIREGEFDFSVTYEYNGEIKTVSGVYVCAYNGMDWALDGGYYRDWTGYIQGGNTDDYVPIDIVDGDEIILVLNLVPDYFMDDFIEGYREVPKPYISVTVVDDEGLTFFHEPEEVEKICGARIISYEYAEPIENTFISILKK
jgi:hypothetical protein